MGRSKFRADQIIDEDLVTDVELAAGFKTDQVVASVFPISVASTDSGTKTVTLSSGGVEEWLQVGDVAEISGGTPDGDYTVASIISDTEFTVEETIPDSTSEGSFTGYHAIGASKVGVDESNLANASGANVQEILESLDSQVGGGGSLPSATQEGQVLYSVDGTTFSVQTPIISEDGWLVNESGCHIVQG